MTRWGWFTLLPVMLSAQSPVAAATPGADVVRSIREITLDVEQCYVVRDMSFAREDVKFFFNDGLLMFARPVAGEVVAAVFGGGEDAGDGELLLQPPGRDERQSLAKFTKTPNFDEHFQTAIFTFTDDTYAALRSGLATGARGIGEAADCQALAARWNPSLQGLGDSLAQRIAGDLLSPAPLGGGSLFAALQSSRLGHFDVIFDPLADDQILLGQLTEYDKTVSYDVWTSFPARSTRDGTAPKREMPIRITAWNIAATLDDTLRLKARSRATFVTGPDGARALSFVLSHMEQVTAVRVDGAPAELLFQESARSRALRSDENVMFLVLAPEVLAAGTTHEIEFEHEGAVVVDRGSGVYTVAARGNWYPRVGQEFAAFDMEFRYPKDLTLVATGSLVEDRIEGPVHITRRRTDSLVPLAGFNLGHYARTSKNIGGMAVDVYGYRALDPALAPKPRMTVVTQPVRGLYRGAPATMQTMTILQTPLPPDPLGRMDAVAADVSASLDFFSSIFGPPPIKTLTISPIPGNAGQGFPGLIYLPTLSYIDELERPQNVQASRQRTFYTDLMVAHEVAHQWWGDLVTVAAYQDEWIQEALAQYSSLLWLEKKRGIAAVNAELEYARAELLALGPDGRTMDSFGPLVWGFRLESSRNLDQWRVMAYGKGAWVFHMLRRRLGDERFLAMLGELRRRFQFKAMSTRDLEQLAVEFGARKAAAAQPPPAARDEIEALFDSWVRSTGIPQVRLKYSSSGKAPQVKVTGSVEYEKSDERSVSGDFSTEIPLEIQYANGQRSIEWVRSGDRPMPFTLTLRQAPVRISVATTHTLATSR